MNRDEIRMKLWGEAAVAGIRQFGNATSVKTFGNSMHVHTLLASSMASKVVEDFDKEFPEVVSKRSPDESFGKGSNP